jgi:methionyl-tRNA synthetase
MNQKYFDGRVPEPSTIADTESEARIRDLAATVAARADERIEAFAIHEAIAAVWELVDALNGYITEQEPWALAKDPEQRERLATVLYTVTEGLRALAVLLAPVIPQATAKLWTALGAEAALGALSAQPIREAGDWGRLPAGTEQQPLAVLFPRIEADSR